MPKVITLIELKPGVPVRLESIAGGQSVRQRLFSLGFHVGDTVEVKAQGILRGPVLVMNLTTGNSVAIGLGIAGKIRVEVDGVS